MKILVNLTQEHIDHGIKKDCTKCPVALAVTDALDKKGIKFYEVRVATKISVWSLDENTIPTYKTFSISQHTVETIFAFDRGTKIYPFKFYISH